MNFFQQSRYKTVKFCQCLVGLWPHQKKSESLFFLGVALFFSGSLVSAQIRKVIIDCHNPETIIGAVAPFIIDFVCIIKVLSSILNSRKICQILKCIEEDFNTKMGPEEDVLLQCSEDGRRFSIIYAAGIYSLTLIFLIFPAAPKIIVSLGIANISTPAQFPFPVDYFVDPEKNYRYIQTHISIGVFFIISIIVAVDCLFVTIIQHACGIFSAIGYRLEHLAETNNLNIELHPSLVADKAFWTVIDCIKKHNDAIQFVQLINSTYSVAFFFIVGANMGTLTFTAFQVVLNLDSRDMEQMFTQVFSYCGQVIHLFFVNYLSQRVTNHSLRVNEALNMTRWYRTSIRTRKLLNVMLMRSIIPCDLKCGKMYTMSMANFSSVLRVSMSYFTVLCSLQ